MPNNKKNMSKQSRKRRAKHKELAGSQSLALRNAGQRVQQSVISSKGVPEAKLPETMFRYADRYGYVLSDLKRALLIAVPLFVVLIILSFILH